MKQQLMKKPNTLALAIALSLATSAQAQTAPNIGDVLQQVKPSTPVQTQPQADLPKVGGIDIEPPMQALPQGPQIQVNQFDIIGNREIEKSELQAIIKDDANKRLSLADLELIAQKITKHYRTKGYFVARAYIPAQEIDNNTVKIRVVEGNYGQFHLKNTSLVRDDIVQAMLDDVKDYDIVSLDTLERAMLIINDTPGAQIVRADVMPGQKVGTSDFAVGTKATPAQNGFVLMDNYGSVYTGKHRLSFNYDANSPTGRGDRLSISGLTTEGSGIFNARIGYSTLLMPNGLRGEIAASHTQYELGDIYRNSDAKGTAKGLDATFTYPIRRIRAQTIEGMLNLSHKDLEDKFGTSTTPKDSKSITAGINLRDERNLIGYDGLTTASISLTAGELSINDNASKALDAAGPDTHGSYSKANLSLARVSLLPNQFTLTASLKYQNAIGGKNLDASERMSVSGFSGVYAYPSGELIGSNATLAKLELSRPLPAIQQLNHSWSVFTTKGHAEVAKDYTSAPKGRDISDVGLGWKGSYQGAIINAHLAYRLEDTAPISEKVDRTRLLLQAGWVF